MRALVLACAAAAAAALSFDVSAGRPRCFRENMGADAVLSGAFQLLNPSADRDVALSVTGPDDVALHEAAVSGESKGRFSPRTLVEGWHSVCFDVTREDGDDVPPARLQLQLLQGEASSYGELATLVNVNTLQTSVRKLKARMDFIQSQQDKQKQREREFAAVVDEANSGAVWNSVVQVLVLVLAALAQVKHLQTFFHQKKLV